MAWVVLEEDVANCCKVAAAVVELELVAACALTLVDEVARTEVELVAP